MDLRTADVKNLSRLDLETLAVGIPGYPPGRAGAARVEILRRDRALLWTKVGAWAAVVGALAAIVAAATGIAMLLR